MKVTKPQDKASSDFNQLTEAVNKFENEFAKQENGLPRYHLVIAGEYSRTVCDEVQKIYAESGWDATCRTSTENGGRGGLTVLILQVTKSNEITRTEQAKDLVVTAAMVADEFKAQNISIFGNIDLIEEITFLFCEKFPVGTVWGENVNGIQDWETEIHDFVDNFMKNSKTYLRVRGFKVCTSDDTVVFSINTPDGLMNSDLVDKVVSMWNELTSLEDIRTYLLDAECTTDQMEVMIEALYKLKSN